MATIAGPARHRGDHGFFLISAIVMTLLVVIAFSMQLALGRSTFSAPPVVHLHAVLFMGWVGFYLLQNALVWGGSVRLHRRLGWIGAGWIAVLVVLGPLVTVMMARRGTTPFFFEPAFFIVMNTLSVLCFAGLSTAAIVMRRRTDWHRRLHFCGMAFLIGPAFGRLLPLPLLIPHAAWAVFAGVMLFPIAGALADCRRSGRVHPAWWWGMAAMLATQLLMGVVGRSEAGVALYRAAVAGSPGAAVDPLALPPPPGPPLIAGRDTAI